MEITIKFVKEWLEWLSQRGVLVRLTSDLYDSSLKRIRVTKGETAYIMSNYIRENNTITIQPTDRYYPIHDCPVGILEFVSNDDKHLID